MAALAPLLDAHLDEWEFGEEAGQQDGTLAHVIERGFAMSSRQAGLDVTSVTLACGGQLTDTTTGTYPFAKRS